MCLNYKHIAVKVLLVFYTLKKCRFKVSGNSLCPIRYPEITGAKIFLQCKDFIYYKLSKQIKIVEYTTYAAKFGIPSMELQSVQNLLFYEKPVRASFCFSR